MAKETLKFSDLSKYELEELKDLYISSRLNNMTEVDLRSFVKISLDDQIKGTVGNEEEREAWDEMKEYFKDDFEEKVLEIQSKRSDSSDGETEKDDLQKRIKIVEQRKKEKEINLEDMW